MTWHAVVPRSNERKPPSYSMDAFKRRRGAAGKRVLDVCLSLLLIIFTAPLICIVSLAVAIESRGPVVYRQRRNGLHKKTFTIYKFRTMKHAPDTDRQAQRNDPRITRVGMFLRRSSIDELPQLFNVLLGDMSFVGPRPHPIWLDTAYAASIPDFERRYSTKPGITGLAQIRGFRGGVRSQSAMMERVESDLEYVENWSIYLDIKILALTLLYCWFEHNAY